MKWLLYKDTEDISSFKHQPILPNLVVYLSLSLSLPLSFSLSFVLILRQLLLSFTKHIDDLFLFAYILDDGWFVYIYIYLELIDAVKRHLPFNPQLSERDTIEEFILSNKRYNQAQSSY